MLRVVNRENFDREGFDHGAFDPERCYALSRGEYKLSKVTGRAGRSDFYGFKAKKYRRTVISHKSGGD